MKKQDPDKGPSAAELIDEKFAGLADWRGETLSRMRKLIKEEAPEVVETWKWMGTPVWEHGGIICTGESYKDKVKLTFARGASIADPSGLFNSSLDGNVRRAIDFPEGAVLDENAPKALVRSAAAHNKTTVRGKPKRAASPEPWPLNGAPMPLETALSLGQHIARRPSSLAASCVQAYGSFTEQAHAQ